MKEVSNSCIAGRLCSNHFEHLFSVSSENSWAVHGREHFLGSSNAPLGFHGCRPANMPRCFGPLSPGWCRWIQTPGAKRPRHPCRNGTFRPPPHVSSPPWLRPPRWNFQTLAQVPPLEQLALVPPQPPVQGYLWAMRHWGTWEMVQLRERKKYFKRSTLEENQNRLSKMFLILS